MNIENLNHLKSWCLAGAPHVHFDMGHGLGGPEYIEMEMENVPTDCGTVCCIAGAAQLMSQGILGNLMAQKRFADSTEVDWHQTRDEALNWLGLDHNGTRMGHDLFDMNLAPDPTTPKQAAQAIQNVIDGNEPWS